MRRVTGIGGVFFKAKDPKALADWYRDTLSVNVEDLLLTGTSTVSGVGNAANNYIEGNSGATNYLDGGAGADTMKGGDGNDVYYVDNVADVVIETNAVQASGGTDMVVTTVSYTLGANVENILLVGNDSITGVGNALGNYIEGNAAVNFLAGQAGADTMKGNDGSDTYYVDDIADVVIETNAVQASGGTDTVSTTISYALGANVENLILSGTAAISGTGNALGNYMVGNAAANGLAGGDGLDTLVGGAGTDSLTGGLGADVFDFNALTESLVGASRDVITDFASSQGDKVDVSGIDANANVTGDQAFAWIGTTAFSAAGQLRYTGTVLAGDVDGNGVADFEVQIVGMASLVAGDFVL